MKKISRYIFIYSIPLLSLLYGIGDYQKWWDVLSGRQLAESGIERLATGEGYPKSWIYSRDKEFGGLLTVINYGTKNQAFRDRLRKGIRPSLITFTAAQRQKINVPSDWPSFYELSPSALVLCCYGESKGKFKKEDAIWVGSISEVNRWVDSHRNRERFWVTTILLGLLSLLVAFFEGLRG
jgi:hypothetical protein